MSHALSRSSLDPWAAAGMVALAGVGTVLAAGGAAAGQMGLLVVGAGLGAVGLGLLIAAGWLDPLLLVALAIPLPAVVSDETVRVATVAPVAALAVAAWMMGSGTPGRVLRLEGLPWRSLGLLASALLLSAVFSAALATSAREVLNLAVLFGLLVAAVDLLARDPEKRERLITALALVAGLTGALAVLETVGVLPGAFPRFGTPFNRAALGFGQPNGLGLFFATVIPLIAYRRVTAKGYAARAVWTLCLAAAGLGLVGTFSRGGWLGLVLGAAALMLVGEARTVLRIWLATAAIVLILDVVSGGAMRDTAVRTVGDWVLEQRAALMLAGVLMFLDHPVLGMGPGGFAEHVEEYAPLVPQLSDIQPTPHNTVIQMAAESGIVGVIALLFFTVVVFRGLRRHCRGTSDPRERKLQLAVLWSLGSAAVASMAMWPFAHGTGEAVILVLALACVPPTLLPGAHSDVRRVRWVGVG